MYDLAPVLDAEVESGTNLLVTGPPSTGKRALGLDVLAEGTRTGDGAIVVTTKDSADRVLEDYADRVPHEGRPVGVVDCVSRHQGVSDLRDDDRIKYASSPVDMTNIGIKFSEFLQTFHQTRDVQSNRIMVHSLSTFLLSTDLQTVFRFLHVFTGRARSVDGLGLFCIDSTAHDERTLDTLRQLFDGTVATHEDGAVTLHLANG